MTTEQERMDRERLRQLAAVAAMEGMLAADDEWVADKLAGICVKYANALVAELSKAQPVEERKRRQTPTQFTFADPNPANYISARDPHPDYAPIKQSAYDSIAKIAFECWTHKDSYVIQMCPQCVKEQLAAEYERGKADQRAEAKGEKP